MARRDVSREAEPGYWIEDWFHNGAGTAWANVCHEDWTFIPDIQYCQLYPYDAQCQPEIPTYSNPYEAPTYEYASQPSSSRIAWPPPLPEPYDDDDYLDSTQVSDSLPPCSNLASIPAGPTRQAAHVWCIAGVQMDSTQRATMQGIFNDIRSKGGVCATLAAYGDTLILKNRIRIYSNPNNPTTGERTYPFSGAASPNQKGNGWMITQVDWFRFVSTPARGVKTMKQHLAHELDHLDGQIHISNTNLTPREISCGT